MSGLVLDCVSCLIALTLVCGNSGFGCGACVLLFCFPLSAASQGMRQLLLCHRDCDASVYYLFGDSDWTYLVTQLPLAAA